MGKDRGHEDDATLAAARREWIAREAADRRGTGAKGLRYMPRPMRRHDKFSTMPGPAPAGAPMAELQAEARRRRRTGEGA